MRVVGAREYPLYNGYMKYTLNKISNTFLKMYILTKGQDEEEAQTWTVGTFVGMHLSTMSVGRKQKKKFTFIRIFFRKNLLLTGIFVRRES